MTIVRIPWTERSVTGFSREVRNRFSDRVQLVASSVRAGYFSVPRDAEGAFRDLATAYELDMGSFNARAQEQPAPDSVS